MLGLDDEDDDEEEEEEGPQIVRQRIQACVWQQAAGPNGALA